MKKGLPMTFVTAALLVPAAASAGERVTDAALGAASGALVAGPVGLVAGGVIGFTAGPNISHGLGLRHYHHHYDHSRTASNRRAEKAGETRPDAR